MAYDAPRLLLLLLLIFFFFLSPDTKAPSAAQLLELEDRIANEGYALQTLNTSNYNDLDAAHDRWLNLTGLRNNDGYVWRQLPQVKEKARQRFERAAVATQSQAWNSSGLRSSGNEDGPPDYEDLARRVDPFRGQLPMYSNVTSVLRGKWVRSAIEEMNSASNFNITALAPNVTYTTAQMSRNITGRDGDLRVKLTEQSTDETFDTDPRLIRKIKAEMVIKDETSSGDGWDTILYGVHFVRRGSIVVSTTSEKFEGIFALPHFTHSAEAFSISKKLMLKNLAGVIDKQKTSPDASLNPWTSMSDMSGDNHFLVPHCEIILYLQQEPPRSAETSFQAVEEELRSPTGARLGGGIPQIQMSAVIFSPDCGFILESKGPPDYSPTSGVHLRGRKIEAYMNETRSVILFFSFLICAQILLLKHQMNEASTPSTKSRISFYTIIVMALGDGFACMSFLVAGMFMDDLFLALISAAFLSFLCVSFFGMKFLMDIWNVQAPERLERERERQRLRNQQNLEDTANRSDAQSNSRGPSTSTTNLSASAEPGTLPLPATASRFSANSTPTPIIITPDQDLDAALLDDADAELAPPVPSPTNNPPTNPPQQTSNTRRELGALYTRFYFALLSLLFLSLWATSWPTFLRTLYTNTFSLLYLSPFVPQIHRNVIRNCRKALTWRFVIGESILRLVPFAYFWCWEENILFADNDGRMFLVMVGWVWCQVFVLGVQEVVGPRVFVPDGWAPQAYDYHPVLREGDAETGGNMPIGFTEAIADSSSSPVATGPSSSATTGVGGRTSKKVEGSQRSFDCAICTETFEVPVIGLGESEASASTATLFARRSYMVTPCRHIFHSSCLEGWMRYRLQCPICREGVPPL